MRHHILYLFLFIIPVISCQTIYKNEKGEENEKAILNSHKNLIINFLNKGVPYLALKELRRLIREYPEDSDFINLMGLTHLALENHNQAIKFFRQSFDKNPRPGVALNVSSAYIKGGEYEKSIHFLKKYLEKSSSNQYEFPERIFHNIAFASEKIDRLKDAERYYSLALAENPNYYLSLMRLGKVYERMSNPEEARKSFSRANIACATCFEPVNALTLGYIARGKEKQAYSLLKKYANNSEISDDSRTKAQSLLKMVSNVLKARQPPPSSKQKTIGTVGKSKEALKSKKTF